jgi:hypothetical protein
LIFENLEGKPADGKMSKRKQDYTEKFNQNYQKNLKEIENR